MAIIWIWVHIDKDAFFIAFYNIIRFKLSTGNSLIVVWPFVLWSLHFLNSASEMDTMRSVWYWNVRFQNDDLKNPQNLHVSGLGMWYYKLSVDVFQKVSVSLFLKGRIWTRWPSRSLAALWPITIEIQDFPFR